jgi:hypothetical protein
VNQINKKRHNLTVKSALLLAMLAGSLTAQAAEEWELPRTSTGHPVLQGYWTNSTVVPLQRSVELGDQAFYTIEEAMAKQQAAIDTIRAETVPGTTADIHYQMDDYALDKSVDTIASNLRTSIITSPANGRLPQVTPEAEAIAATAAIYREEHGYDSAQDRSLSERCVLWSNVGPPMIPLGYNSTLQIMQTEDHVVVLAEMIHDTRVIPFVDRNAESETLPQWLGNSIAYWDGDTLVIETTGFSGSVPGRNINAPMSVDAKVTERISRNSENSLSYAFTVEDSTLWEESWGGEYPMQSINGPLFEYACHEGNYGIVNILNGRRVQEREEMGLAN